jgi:hypothetical protein
MQQKTLVAVMALIAVTTACGNPSTIGDRSAELTPIPAAPAQETTSTECQDQFLRFGESIRETTLAIDRAEDEFEQARVAFVASRNREEAERGLAALNNQAFRLSGLYGALSADTEIARTSAFPELAARFAAAAREMSVAYAGTASSGSPERIIATRPLMDAAWRALGSACDDM